MSGMSGGRSGRKARFGGSVIAAAACVLVSAAPAGAAAVALVEDINPGPAAGVDNALLTQPPSALSGGRHFFPGITATSGYEPWITDGTAAGTYLVKDINPGTGNSDPFGFGHVGGKTIFDAGEPTRGAELWVSDGTSAGTTLLKELVPGAGDGDSGLPMFSFTLHCRALVCLTYGNLDAPEMLNGELYFTGNRQVTADTGETENQSGIWKSNGTAAGTQFVDRVSGGGGLTALDNRILMRGETFNRSGIELHAVDANGVTEVANLHGVPADDPNQTGDRISWSSLPDNFTRVGNRAFFNASSIHSGHELWVSDGTTTNTRQVADLSPGGESDTAFGYAAEVDGELYFIAGTPAEGLELWRSDGTQAGTRIAAEINPGPESSLASDTGFVELAGHVYFAGVDAEHGAELWRVAKSGSEPELVRDINPGTPSSTPLRDGTVYDFFLFNLETRFPWQARALGDGVFFAADNGVDGNELWVSDGTEAGTRQVADINSEGASNPDYMLESNGRLLFAATDPDHGHELRVGTPDLKADTPNVAFDATMVGSTSELEVTVRNAAPAPATTGPVALRFQQPHPESFEIVNENCSSRTIAPGGSCEVTVGFTPRVAQLATANLHLDAVSGGAVDVSLSGSGKPKSRELLVHNMSGAQTRPTFGDGDGRGAALIDLRPGGQLCAGVRFARLLPPVLGVAIHRGRAGTAGPSVVDLGPVLAGTSRCVSASGAVLREIRNSPGRFYLSIQTAGFTGGAIRGQLSRSAVDSRFNGATGPTHKFSRMSGGQETSGAGDPNGVGVGFVDVSPAGGLVCVDLRYRGIQAPTALSLNRGTHGEAGPAVIDLDPVLGGTRCVSAQPTLLKEIRDRPGRFYLGIRNSAFAAGAIRGQLESSE